MHHYNRWILQLRLKCIWAGYLTDTTALPLDSSILTVLVNLIREERVKDLVDQFGGGGFSGTLAVLLDLGGMTYGLSSGRSPEDQNTISDASHTTDRCD